MLSYLKVFSNLHSWNKLWGLWNTVVLTLPLPSSPPTPYPQGKKNRKERRMPIKNLRVSQRIRIAMKNGPDLNWWRVFQYNPLEDISHAYSNLKHCPKLQCTADMTYDTCHVAGRWRVVLSKVKYCCLPWVHIFSWTVRRWMIISCWTRKISA